MYGSAWFRSSSICNLIECFMSSSRVFASALLAAATFAAPAIANPPSGGHWSHGGPHFTFAHRDFQHFTPVERRSWTIGHWSHGWHRGHFGWWWFAGGLWYFYTAPIYPYPGYVSDYYADEDYGPNYPGGPVWYYCANPPGYYPYVRTCSIPWRPVPAAAAPGYGPPPGASGAPAPNDQPPPDYQGPPDNAPQNGPPPDNQGPPADMGPQDAPPPPGSMPPPPGPNGPPPEYNGPN